MPKKKIRSNGVMTEIAFLLLLSFVYPAYAQFDSAAVLGTVTDESGSVIAGAAVTLTNIATGISANTQTDEDGNYQFLNVKIGTYKVEVRMQSFSTAVIENVGVSVNARQRVDFSPPILIQPATG